MFKNRWLNLALIPLFVLIGYAGSVVVEAKAAPAPVVQRADNPENPPRWMTSPCKYEDSRNCFWNAETAGNGSGHSFYSIAVGKKDCVIYWNNRYAKRHNYCVKVR